MEVINQTPQFLIKSVGNTYTIDFANVRKGTSVTSSVLIKNAAHVRTTVYCSVCTKAEHTQLGNDILLNITYRADAIGGIGGKLVDVTLADNQKITFKLIGTVA